MNRADRWNDPQDPTWGLFRGNGRGLFLEDELDEGGVEIVSDVLVLLFLGDEFVCTFR